MSFKLTTCNSYAICDSPTGLLAFVLRGLCLLAPGKSFTPEQLITLTNLAWLPGPEYAMRFWAHCAKHEQEKDRRTKSVKPNVAITVFLGGEDEETGDASTAQEVGEGAISLDVPMKGATGIGYTCPAWGKIHYNVLFSQRVSGKPGLLAWERPETILSGIRGLAREIRKVDKRLQPVSKSPTAPLESVVVTEETEEQNDGLKPPQRPMLEQGDSSRTQVGSQPPASPKGKEPEIATSEGAAKSKDLDGPDSPIYQIPDTAVKITAPTEENVAE